MKRGLLPIDTSPLLFYDALVIGVITNVHSRKNRRGRYNRYVLKEALGNASLIRETELVEEIPTVLQEFKKKGVQILCVNGGDGSLSLVLTRLFDLYPPSSPLPKILHLRGGTINMASNNMKVFGTPLIAARRLRQRLFEADNDPERLELIPFWTLKLEASFLKKPIHGFCFCDGMIYRIIKDFYETGKGSSAKAMRYVSYVVGGSMLQLQDVLPLWEKTQGTITVDGKKLPMKEHTLLLASTFPKLPLGFAPFAYPNRKTDDFNFIAFNVGLGETMRNFPAWARGIGADVRPKRDDFFNDRVKQVEIESEEGFVIDGEVFESEKPYQLRLSLGRKISVVKL